MEQGKGYIVADHNAACIGLPNTICFIEDTDGHRFGAFMAIKHWVKNDYEWEYKQDHLAFIFSLDKKL